MKARVLHLPVSGGPDGRSYVRMEQSVRQARPRYRPSHLLAAFGVGWMSALFLLGMLSEWSR